MFVYSNFSYWSLLWHFSAQKCLKKVQKVQKQFLRLLQNEHINNYLSLLEISEKPKKKKKVLRILEIEIFKILNWWKPGFMKKFFNYCCNSFIREIIFKLTIAIYQNLATKAFAFCGHIYGTPLQKILNPLLQSINLNNS